MAVIYTTDVAAAVARGVRRGHGARPVRSAAEARFAHVVDLHGNEFVLAERNAAAS